MQSKLKIYAKYICYANKNVKSSHFGTALHSVPYLRVATSLPLAKEN
jgi:hypothetical protein